MEGVILSILQTVLGSKDSVLDSSLPETSLEAFLQSASFTEEGGGEGEAAAAACMSMQDFRKWCASTPSVKRFLTTLLKGPTSGMYEHKFPDSKPAFKKYEVIVITLYSIINQLSIAYLFYSHE